MNQSADQHRDEKLRADMLRILKTARGNAPMHGLSGDRLMAEVSTGLSREMDFEDEAHFLRLAHDLAGAGVVEEKDKGTRQQHERFMKPRHLFFLITFKGVQLLEQKIPPIPGIPDGRATD
jgi:hypothetical protein